MARLALIGAVAVSLAVWAAVGFGAATIPAPTITASPANPSSSRSASFTYTDSQAVTNFECALDDGAFSRCGSTRPSSKSVNGLSDGSHVFRVRAVSGSATSAATSYSWVVDATPPRVASITRVGSSLTNAATVQWTVTFTERVTGAAPADFSLAATRLTGSPAVTALAGSDAVYTVTASTGTGALSPNGTLQLRLTNGGAIRDAAGNALAGVPSNGQTYTIDTSPPAEPTITSGPPQPPAASPSADVRFRFNGEGGATFLCSLDGSAPETCSSPTTYAGVHDGAHTFSVRARDAAGNVSPAALRVFVVDTVAPDKPTLTQTPPDPSTSRDATFAWTTVDPAPRSGIASERCKRDAGAYKPCTSPWTYATLGFGSHTFSVIAVDFAGNESPAATFTWTIVQQGLPFSLAGNASALLVPGAPFSPIALTITNPNRVPIFVTSITVTVTGDASGCAAADLDVQQSPASPSDALKVPARAVNWPVPPVFQPKIRLTETGKSQDVCKGRTFSLSYTGSAHS